MKRDVEAIAFGIVIAGHCFGDAGDACDTMAHVDGSAAAHGHGKGSVGNVQATHYTGWTGALPTSEPQCMRTISLHCCGACSYYPGLIFTTPSLCSVSEIIK